jgi:hypothetical protein
MTGVRGTTHKATYPTKTALSSSKGTSSNWKPAAPKQTPMAKPSRVGLAIPYKGNPMPKVKTGY